MRSLFLPGCLLLLAGIFTGSAHGEPLAFEPNTAVWGALNASRIVEGPFNPANRAARAAKEIETIELRPDWKLSASAWRLTARPRLIATSEAATVAGARSRRTLAKWRWSEGFATLRLSDAFTLAYGLQNFQWGPAESGSPSNRIFRDTIQAKDILYAERGHHLIRLSWAPSASWSEVFLLEPTGNGDPEPEPGEPHALKAALKTELSWSGGSDFAGFVVGWRDRMGFWLGEYVNLELKDGFFAYVDLSHRRGSLAYYPAIDPTGRFTVFTPSRRYEERIYSFSISGLRYAFENGNDWRIEWIFQEDGYRSQELNQVRESASSTDLLQLASLASSGAAIRQPGLDFPGVHYLFSSARFPNAFGMRDWNLYLRALRSLQDASAATFASSENAVGEHGTFITSLGATFGAEGRELKGAVDLAMTLAYRHAW